MCRLQHAATCLDEPDSLVAEELSIVGPVVGIEVVCGDGVGPGVVGEVKCTGASTGVSSRRPMVPVVSLAGTIVPAATATCTRVGEPGGTVLTIQRRTRGGERSGTVLKMQRRAGDVDC